MFTYTGDPNASMRDGLRFEIGDTDADSYRFEDAEIDWLLRKAGVDPTLAGDPVALRPITSALKQSTVLELLAQPSYKLGNFEERLTEAAKAYADQVNKARVWEVAQGLYAGGISVSDKEAARENPDRPRDTFRVGMMDNPGTPMGLWNPRERGR